VIAQLRYVSALALLASIHVLGCSAADEDATSTDDEALSGSPDAINIGFNGGPDQFAYYQDFFGASSIRPGPRLCHTYIAWNIAEQPAGMGDAESPRGSRATFEYWLSQAKGHCDEALISFQAYAPNDGAGHITHPIAPPTEKEFARAFEAFLATRWSQETGFTGAFSFTPWNEPNNPASDGNGLGNLIEPETAAQYYLAASRFCAPHGCKVAAGDFASNGNMWNDLEWNCADDTSVHLLDPARAGKEPLCKTASAFNKDGRPASYLDRYKNYIANHADEYGLGRSFRPKYFAFHGWHDANNYLHENDHCSDYETCAGRRVIKSLGGSWGGAQIWDTEVGIDQDGPAISDREQACGAAFVLRLKATNRRNTRIYYTRLHGGSGELLQGHAPRAALEVLAKRQTQAPSGGCR
jgi:hypothetical protein